MFFHQETSEGKGGEVPFHEHCRHLGCCREVVKKMFGHDRNLLPRN